MYYDTHIFSPFLLKEEISDALECRGELTAEDQEYLTARMIIISRRKGKDSVKEISQILKNNIKNEALLEKINKFS